ncbi:MAG: hypothetical protein JWN70_3397 [Planctomycetaceae bacterium]|nr:hypothetical protein [Planctomycetaceae bacterium]
MRMQYGMGFVLAVMLSVSGCCCPMTCSPPMTCAPMTCAPMSCAPMSCTPCCYPQPCCPQPSWTEKFEDAYWDLSDCVHHHGCHLQQSLSCSMKQLAANLTPTNSYSGENNYKQMPASAKIPPQAAPKEKKHRTCQRCKQAPCRCGYCEGCDGFEEVDPNAPANTEVYQDQYYTVPPGATDPYQELPPPVSPVPTPGPTPIFKNPPPAAPENSTPAPVTPPVTPPVAPPANPPQAEPVSPPAPPLPPTARLARPTAPKTAPANSTSARTTTTVSARTTEPKLTATPIDVSIPADEEFKLKPINFTTHAPLTKDGWEPAAQNDLPVKSPE